TRRRSSRPISDDQILRLVSQLHRLLPPAPPSISKISANKVLEETCEYIRKLQREIEDLSTRLSQLLLTVDEESPEAAIIRALIM
ncbi:transcription factor style2.1, partial [Genlisea aurea]